MFCKIKMYETGFLPPCYNTVRMKQGLMSQALSNDCHRNDLMYPVPEVYVNYEDKPISNACPCVRYVLPA